MNSIRSLLKSILLTLIFLNIYSAAETVTAQDERRITMYERLKQMELDSLYTGLWVYYPEGYAGRAEVIARRISASNQFFSDSLGVDVRIRIALLDPENYERGEFLHPYGLPFISGGVTVLPADLNSGAVIDMFTPFEATITADNLAVLQKAGFTYGEANKLMVDLIGLHEIGHEQVRAFGINTRQRWFDELMASYLAYAYLRTMEPRMAVVWDAVTRAGREGYQSNHTSLDDFNRLYTGVGVGDYVWYQNVFHERVRDVYDVHGLAFVREVKNRLGNTHLKTIIAEELLAVLEEIAPGFMEWAAMFEL
ncbi:MAG: hypothetical protein LC662_04315 [Rhodothermaceae bacterium]|nr:hypothetical protein [Rhodothermaceae bacterium]